MSRFRIETGQASWILKLDAISCAQTLGNRLFNPSDPFASMAGGGGAQSIRLNLKPLAFVT